MKENSLESNQNIPENTSTLADRIAESKERLAGESLKAVKRGRGRPRGSKKVTTTSSGPIHDSAASTLGASTGAPSPTSEAIDIPVALLKPVLQFPFRIAASKTGYEGFNLSDDEADSMAPMLDQVLKAYLPQLNGPQAALAALGASLAVITSTKYLAMLEWKRLRHRIATEHMPQEHRSNEAPSPAPMPTQVFDENHNPLIDPQKLNLKKLFK